MLGSNSATTEVRLFCCKLIWEESVPFGSSLGQVNDLGPGDMNAVALDLVHIVRPWLGARGVLGDEEVKAVQLVVGSPLVENGLGNLGHRPRSIPEGKHVNPFPRHWKPKEDRVDSHPHYPVSSWHQELLEDLDWELNDVFVQHASWACLKNHLQT